MAAQCVDFDAFTSVSSPRRPPECLYLSHGWVAAEEDCAETEPLYVAARSDRDAAALACYGFTERSNPWPFARPDLFLRDVLGVGLPGPSLLPSYCLGGRRPGHSEAIGGTTDLLQSCVATAVDALRARGAAAVVAPYVNSPAFAGALAANGFAELPSLSRWELSLPGTSFSDYVASLPKGTRSNVGIERRRIRDAGLTGRVTPLSPAAVADIVALELAGYARFGHHYQPREAESLHRAVLARLPDDVFVSRIDAEPGGPPVGFAVLVRSGNALYVRQGAVDHDRAGRTPVYFEVGFYQAIEFAYSNGIEVVDFSISSDQAKRLRGCAEVTTRAYVLLSDQARHHALREYLATSGDAATNATG